ncbi:MAG: hypothetical protein E7320_07635 [Clostridiales bacterium]|nr:hypothetical protein [Clostridiales bacterium]
MNIQVNQLGYTPAMQKTALLRGEAGSTLEVRNAAGETVLTLPVGNERTPLWGDDLAIIDFSALTEPGTYTLCSGKESSHPFVVAEKPYQALLTGLVDMLYYQRCGDDLKPEAGLFAHPACHTGLARVWGSEEQREVSGGWHDAGDYGRYIVPAAKTVADMLLAHEWAPAAFVPGLTELMQEARWELEWMLKMQREDGAVYHKVSCASFCGMIMPHEEKEELFLSPVSTTATGDFAACMAMASRHYRESDPAFADRMLEAAKRAWAFLAASGPMLFRNPEGIRTGGYGDWNDADERLWAVVELALACGDSYLPQVEKALESIKQDAAPLGWGDMRGYAAIEGVQLPGRLGESCRAWVLRAAEQLLGRINAYGITMTEQLHWGSNMDVANQGMLLSQAHRLTGEERYLVAAQKQLHYLLGVNPLSYCYVSGFGAQPMRHPHHRPSVAQGVCQPGMLSGGPCSGLADACAKEHLQGQPAGKCFVDDHASYSTNEICIYWNSPLIALVAVLS